MRDNNTRRVARDLFTHPRLRATTCVNSGFGVRADSVVFGFSSAVRVPRLNRRDRMVLYTPVYGRKRRRVLRVRQERRRGRTLFDSVCRGFHFRGGQNRNTFDLASFRRFHNVVIPLRK